MNDRPVVFVVDNDPAVRDGLVALLAMKGCHAAGFASAEEFLGMELDLSFGCLVLEEYLPGLDGFELQNVLQQRGVRLPIIFISARGDVPMAVRAIKSGAAGFLTKPLDERQLLGELEQALVVSRKGLMMRTELGEFQQRYGTLTTREAQVLTFVTSGKLNKQTAAELGIVENTVKVHRRRIMKKMHAESVAELVLIAQKLDLIQKPTSPVLSSLKSLPRRDSSKFFPLTGSTTHAVGKK